MNQKPKFVPGDALATLITCNGYYECPKDPDGKRRGHLVGYAGTYEPGLHFVGDIYMNVAAIETYPWILRHMATELVQQLGPCDWIMGVPEGGKTLAALIAEELHIPFIYPEKEVIRIGTEAQRGESRFVMNRHQIPSHSRGLVCEDVVNNFSSTRELIDLVEENTGTVGAIACLFNRSTHEVFEHGQVHPVISLASVPMAQYRQDNTYVEDDVISGNIIWKPKAAWPRLVTIMANEQERRHGAPTSG